MASNIGDFFRVYSIVDSLRKEPYRRLPFRHNCIGKSFRLRKACKRLGIKVKVVITLCLIKNDRHWFLPGSIPFIHGWAEYEGKRIELARPLNELNSVWTYDIDIFPLAGVWI